ncbi:MAG: tetratricopeptide repeat protein [Magnetococcales bacterium]|nr:tetratricopeptide repeat protein [Magnetococcales bacterium]
MKSIGEEENVARQQAFLRDNQRSLVNVLLYKATAHYHLHQNKEAESCLDKALKLDPEYTQSRLEGSPSRQR